MASSIGLSGMAFPLAPGWPNSRTNRKRGDVSTASMTAWIPVAKSNFALTVLNRLVRLVVSVESSWPRKALPANLVMNWPAQVAFWVVQPAIRLLSELDTAAEASASAASRYC